MSNRIESLEDPEFGRLFTGFEHTAYRLETLQVYDVGYEDESFRRFLVGKADPPDQAKDEWTTMIRGAVRAGKVMQRVHVIVEPLTDYLRYEIGWSYGPNVEAGEDIRILPAPSWGSVDLPTEDYWLFDSRDLWVMKYDADGRFLFTVKVADPAEIVRHCYWRDAALHRAIRFRDYVGRAPELARNS
jgi:hypothetical protein